MGIKKGQRRFAQFFALGLFLNWNWLAPWHEFGHVVGAMLSGKEARITSIVTTMVYGDATPFILLAGPLWEVLTWPAFLLVCIRFRAPMGWHGLFWAQFFSSYAFSPFTTDLTSIYAQTGIDPLWWWFYTAPAVILWATIMRRAYGKDRRQIRRRDRGAANGSWCRPQQAGYAARSLGDY